MEILKGSGVHVIRGCTAGPQTKHEILNLETAKNWISLYRVHFRTKSGQCNVTRWGWVACRLIYFLSLFRLLLRIFFYFFQNFGHFLEKSAFLEHANFFQKSQS